MVVVVRLVEKMESGGLEGRVGFSVRDSELVHSGRTSFTLS